MLLRQILSSFTLLAMLFSCAQSPVNTKQQQDQKPLNQMSAKEIEQLNQQSIDRVSVKLKELSAAAKQAGPAKVKFLASDMYLKASAALMEGDYYTANIIFQHLTELVPEDTFVKQKYVISLIRTGEFDKSKLILEDLFEKSGRKDPKIGLVLAGVYDSLGFTPKARQTYKRLVATNPKNEESCIFLAKSYVVEKKVSKGVQTLSGCAKKNPKKALFDYYIGKIYLEDNKPTLAKKFFRRALSKEKDFSLAVIALGMMHEEKGNYLLAEKLYKKHLKRTPGDTLVLSRIVQLLFTQEKFKEVIEYAERLSDYESDNLNLKVKLGILYKDTQQYSKAIKTFKDLLNFAPDNDKILYYLGSIFQEIKNFEDAIVYFGKIKQGSDLYHDSSFQIAQMLSLLAKDEYFNKKEKGPRHEKFISFIDNKIDELEGFKVEFSVVKAVYFEGLLDNEEAIDVLLYVRDEKTFGNEHRFYLASLFEKEEEFNKATELIEEIIEFEPQNAHAWNFLGYSLIERGENMDEAYKYIKKAIDLKPNDGYIRDSLGWYYYKSGDVKKALSEIQKALGAEPNDVAINKHMAIIYTSMKDFKKAKEYIVKALALVQSDSERKELTDALKQLEQNRVPASFQNN